MAKEYVLFTDDTQFRSLMGDLDGDYPKVGRDLRGRLRPTKQQTLRYTRLQKHPDGIQGFVVIDERVDIDPRIDKRDLTTQTKAQLEARGFVFKTGT